MRSRSDLAPRNRLRSYALRTLQWACAPAVAPLAPVLLLLATGCSTTDHPSSRAARDLFNGTDLTGWHVRCQPKDQARTFWSVDRGTILCDSMGQPNHGYVWLVSDEEFEDFALSLEFQVYRSSPGNSGLQFRSRFDPTADGGWLDGPQVDIHPPTPMSWRTGLIYDETRGEQRWVFPGLKDWNIDPGFEPRRHVLHYGEDGDAWNKLVLICRGNRVKTLVNGVTRTDWDGTGVLDNALHRKRNVGRKGHLALQLHSGDELRIRFRNLRIQ